MIRATEPLDDVDPPAPAQIGDTLPDLARLAVDAAGVTRLLSVSERHVWALHSSGRLPLPIKAGRAVRWSVDELRQWLLAGAPPRERWQAMRAENTSGVKAASEATLRP